MKKLIIILCVFIIGTTSMAQEYSLSFDGIDDYIEIPDTDILSPQSFTIEFWVKQPQISSEKYNSYVVKSDGETHVEYCVKESTTPPHDPSGIYAYIGHEYLQSNFHPAPDTWAHIAVTFDTQIDSMNIFKDGNLIANSMITDEVINTMGNLYIGLHPAPGISTNNYLNGIMDEVRISDNIRYSSNFALPTTEFSPDANTIALYHFNEGSGTTTYDLSGNENHGTIFGASWSTDVPLTSNQDNNFALDFSSNQYVRILADTSLSNFSTFTLESWYYQTGFTGSFDEYIVGTEGGGDDGWIILHNDWNQYQGGIYDGTNRLYYGVGNPGGGTDIIENIWTHLAMTYDGSTFRYFINGALIYSEEGVMNSFGPENHDWVINRHTWNNGSASSSRLSGQLDELRISTIARYIDEFMPSNYEFNNDQSTVGLWHFNEGVGDSALDASGHGNTAYLINGAGWSTNTPGLMEPRTDHIIHVSTTGSDETGDGTIENPFASIQKGIDEALEGDTVIVSEGTYVENIDFLGKNIIVASQFLLSEDTTYISQTIIDGNQSGSVVTINNGEDSSAVFTGFTVQNGSGFINQQNDQLGFGLYIVNSNPTIKSLKIMNNSFNSPSNYAYGLGIYAQNSSSNFTNITISENEAYDYYGIGTIYSDNSNLSFEILVIKNNHFDSNGAGVQSVNSNIEIKNLIASNNYNGIYSWFFHFTSGTFLIEDAVFESNDVGDYPHECSLILLENVESGVFNRVRINNNTAVSEEGVSLIDILSSNIKIENTLFFNNTNVNGIGCAYSSELRLNHITNWDKYIYFTLEANHNNSITLLNSIFKTDWNSNFINLLNSDTINIAYTNFSPFDGGVFLENGSILNQLEGNISVSPMFADTTIGDYQLSDSSHCIGAGTDSIEISGTYYYSSTYDISNSSRPNPQGSKPDLGAYEHELGEPLITGIRLSSNQIPIKYELLQNYPNPFNPATKIKFALPKGEYVVLEIFNIMGQHIAILENNELEPGYYEVEFNASNLASGIYFYRLSAGDYVAIKRMMLIK